MLKNGYFKSFLFFITFLITYISNFFLPFSRLYPYADIDTLSAYDTRPWNWTISIFLILAILFILKYRKFSMTYLSYALVLGILSGCGKYIWFDANLLLLCKDMTEVSIIFYSACLIYEALPYLQSKVDFLPLKILKSFVFGVVVSIPFAIINVIYFSMSAPININSFFSSFIEAFQPALAEEIPFRFFLYGILCYFLKGKVNDKFFIFFSYFMMVIPHSILHLPSLFIVSPLSAVFMLIITSLVFGLPMAILMVKKNLASAVGFHWFVDFLRFFLGF